MSDLYSPKDPYQIPAADPGPQVAAIRLPVVLLVTSTLVAVALAGWCFYLGHALSTLSAGDATQIENLERLVLQIENEEIAPDRETLMRYFAQNRQFLLDDVRYQRSAQLNFYLVGALLLVVILFQWVIVAILWRRSAHEA